MQRNCQFVADLENRVERALNTGPVEGNPLREMVTDRDEIMGVTYTYQGTDVADFFWNLFNWEYFQRQTPEKQIHLYRLAVVAGLWDSKVMLLPKRDYAKVWLGRMLCQSALLSSEQISILFSFYLQRSHFQTGFSENIPAEMLWYHQ